MSIKIILSNLNKDVCQLKNIAYAFRESEIQDPDFPAYRDHVIRDHDIPEQADLTKEPGPDSTIIYRWSWVEITIP